MNNLIQIDGIFYNCSEITIDNNEHIVNVITQSYSIVDVLNKWGENSNQNFKINYKKDVHIIMNNTAFKLVSSFLKEIKYQEMNNSFHNTVIVNGELSFELSFDYIEEADKIIMIRMMREKKLLRLKELNF